MTETCSDCRFWQAQRVTWPGERRRGVSGPQTDGTVSYCRRLSPRQPQPGPDEGLFGMPMWPRTRHNDWCGEFEPEATPSAMPEGGEP
jgi:hypothetical protein